MLNWKNLFRRRSIQVRLPEPPLLLCDRVTGIEGEPLSMGIGAILTETDVKKDSWYLCNGRMPGGIFIESGQADLLLISWLGIDFLNRGERAYRLLGCELVFYSSLPMPGETLKYKINVDGHAQAGDVRLFFFHYDCKTNGNLRISVRNGQAGFFTKEELATSEGVLWDAKTASYSKNPEINTPATICQKNKFSIEEINYYKKRELYHCFGGGFEILNTHTRTPISMVGNHFFIDEIIQFDVKGGPVGRGYLVGRTQVKPDDWFFNGHFKNDPCMPGTLMSEACLQMMAFYLTALGFTKNNDGWRFEPVTEQKYKFLCRGQVTPQSKELLYEIFVDEIIISPTPTIYAHVLCTVDGLKAFCCERLGLRLVPDYPISSMPELLDFVENTTPDKTIAYDYKALIKCALGLPSEAFGSKFKIFDNIRRTPRLPGPPYHFMTRITNVSGELGKMQLGSTVTVEYDISPDTWYFHENDFQTMPYCVLMEATLQPCGWLATYIGSTLNSPEDFIFRNLDGKAIQYREISPSDRSIKTHVILKSISNLGSVILETFQVTCHIENTLVFEMETGFGFFRPESMLNQKGFAISDDEKTDIHLPENMNINLLEYSKNLSGKTHCKLPIPKLLMLDRIVNYWHQGGRYKKGKIRAEKDVNSAEWFFKAHFFQDPVQPGSLGVEAIIQLMKFYMLHKNMDVGFNNPRFEPIMINNETEWHYRGQVIPANKKITIEFELENDGKDSLGIFIIGQGKLWVDGLNIYQIPKIGLRIIKASA